MEDDSYESYENLKYVNNNENILVKQLKSLYLDQQRRLKQKEARLNRKCKCCCVK